MAKKIKNIDSVDRVWAGQGILAGATYTCLDQNESDKFATSDIFIADLSAGKAEVYNDAAIIVGTSNAITFLRTLTYDITSMPAFAAKTLANGKKLYKRVVGIKASLVVGENTIMWTNTFDWVKFMGIEITGSNHGDTVNFMVLDKAVGPIYGVPNLLLNQFAFNANLFEGNYKHNSEFDADVYKDLQIKMVYTSASIKDVGFNFIMNEVK